LLEFQIVNFGNFGDFGNLVFRVPSCPLWLSFCYPKLRL
jgi:hypothetical protein